MSKLVHSIVIKQIESLETVLEDTAAGLEQLATRVKAFEARKVAVEAELVELKAYAGIAAVEDTGVEEHG